MRRHPKQQSPATNDPTVRHPNRPRANHTRELHLVLGLATTVPLADYAYVASVTAGLRRTEIRSEKRG